MVNCLGLGELAAQAEEQEEQVTPLHIAVLGVSPGCMTPAFHRFFVHCGTMRVFDQLHILHACTAKAGRDRVALRSVSLCFCHSRSSFRFFANKFSCEPFGSYAL